jgi:hypothetical protein
VVRVPQVSVRDISDGQDLAETINDAHFLHVDIELSPPKQDGKQAVDTRVSVKMKGLDFVVSRSLLKRLGKFFSTPFKETEELDQAAIDQVCA